MSHPLAPKVPFYNDSNITARSGWRTGKVFGCCEPLGARGRLTYTIVRNPYIKLLSSYFRYGPCGAQADVDFATKCGLDMSKCPLHGPTARTTPVEWLDAFEAWFDANLSLSDKEADFLLNSHHVRQVARMHTRTRMACARTRLHRACLLRSGCAPSHFCVPGLQAGRASIEAFARPGTRRD